jgi:hypothetical protein
MPMTKGSTALGSMTYAALVASYPASSWTNYTAFVTNWGANGTSVRSNGTRWIPNNGQVILKKMGSAVSGLASTETAVVSVQLPAGVLQAGDTIRIILSLSKTGTTDTGAISVRIGVNGTTADSALTGLSAFASLTAAQISGGPIYAVRILSSTSAQKTGNNSSNASGYGGAGAGAAAAATTGLTDMSSNAVYITVGAKSGGGTDTVGVQEVTIIHEAG